MTSITTAISTATSATTIRPGRFAPQAFSADKYCDAVSGDWSGNFLNWASMTRIDTVRKILYGGYRSTDTSSLTVLERSYLPNDAHSFAKVLLRRVDGCGEIARLTPFSVSEITICNTTYAAGRSESVTERRCCVSRRQLALWAANERHQCHWDGHGEAQENIFNSPNREHEQWKLRTDHGAGCRCRQPELDLTVWAMATTSRGSRPALPA